MKTAIALGLLAAFGNALYALAQKKSLPMQNPFAFGAAALLCAGLVMGAIALTYPTQNTLAELRPNLRWVLLAAAGYVLLFLGLYFLYQQRGPAFYTLYAMLAIVMTSVLMPLIALGQSPDPMQLVASALAVLSVLALAIGAH